MYTELFNPVYGTLIGLPVIAVGVFAHGGNWSWVCFDDEGRTRMASLTEFIADVRFDKGEWKDVSPGAMQALLESEPRE